MNSFDARSSRRATSTDITLSREVVAAVQPVRDRIGSWQSSAVRLRTHYMFEPTGAGKQRLAHEAHALLQEVARTSDRFTAEATILPDAVTRHSRFQDVVRALDSVRATLETFAAPPEQQSGHGSNVANGLAAQLVAEISGPQEADQCALHRADDC